MKLAYFFGSPCKCQLSEQHVYIIITKYVFNLTQLINFDIKQLRISYMCSISTSVRAHSEPFCELFTQMFCAVCMTCFTRTIAIALHNKLKCLLLFCDIIDVFMLSIDRAALLDDRSFASPSRNNRPGQSWSYQRGYCLSTRSADDWQRCAVAQDGCANERSSNSANPSIARNITTACMSFVLTFHIPYWSESFTNLIRFLFGQIIST